MMTRWLSLESSRQLIWISQCDLAGLQEIWFSSQIKFRKIFYLQRRSLP